MCWYRVSTGGSVGDGGFAYTMAAWKQRITTENHLYLADHSFGLPESPFLKDTTLSLLGPSVSFGESKGCLSASSAIFSFKTQSHPASLTVSSTRRCDRGCGEVRCSDATLGSWSGKVILTLSTMSDEVSEMRQSFGSTT